MENRVKYEELQLEVVDIKVEQGFALSDMREGGDAW